MNRRDLALRAAALMAAGATTDAAHARRASAAALQTDAAGVPTSIFNVKAPPFSALGDGATDDLAAINAAIAACADAGGGIVLLPAGVYRVGVSSSAWIVARSNVTLQGAGPATRIKVADTAGTYPAVISGVTHGTRVERFTLRDLTIDQNPAGNATSDIVAGLVPPALFGLYLTDFEDITVENVRFDPYVGVNAVILNGIGCRLARISGCLFRFARGASSVPDYDTSTLYLALAGAVVDGNRFAAGIAEKARGAIEIHGPSATVVGNIVENFQAGCHVVSEYADEIPLGASAVSVVGNAFLGVCFGVTVQANPGHRCRGVAVVANTIHVDQIAHDRARFAAVSVGADAGTGSYEGIDVSHNAISFAYEGVGGRTTTVDREALTEYLNAGIAVSSPAGSVVAGFQIAHNLIDGAPYMAILLGTGSGGTLRAGLVTDNLLVNPGQNAGAAIQDYRTAIFGHAVVFDGVTVERNHHHDTGRDATTPYGARLWSFVEPAAGSERLIVRDNRSRVKVGALVQPPWSPAVQRDEGRGALAWPMITAGATIELTMTVRGAAVGDTVVANPQTPLDAGLVKAYERVAAADTVAIALANVSVVPIIPVPSTWDVAVRTRQG